MTKMEQRRSVLITGASTGIGADAAMYFNERGYVVFAGVRRLEDGRTIRDRPPHPDRFHPVILDITDEAQVTAARNQIEAMLGRGQRLTALISNAGIAAYSGDVSCEGCPIETQQRVMDVNFFGAVRVVQTFLPLIRAARGTVVFTSALMAHTVIPFSGGYAVSKCALEGWADSLRREVTPLGVRVAIIQPAKVTSELEHKQDYSNLPPRAPYPHQRDFLTEIGQLQSRSSGSPKTSPRRVSEIMVRTVESSRPKPRQIVGGNARPIWLIGCLPDRLQDAAIRFALPAIARRAGTTKQAHSPVMSEPPKGRPPKRQLSAGI